MDASQTVRRKAKRIERAAERLGHLKSDIETLDNIGDKERAYLLKQISFIKPYLENDDSEENPYNYDNSNSRKQV